MPRVLVTRELPGPGLNRLRDAHDVEVWPGREPPSPARLRELVADADGLLCLLTDSVDARLLDAAPRLRAIATYAVGTDNVDLGECARRGIAVGNTPDVLTEATADLTFSLLLAAARRIEPGAREVRAGEWRTWEPAHALGADVHGAALGIVGLGRIGRAVARRALGFGMEVLHTREYPLDTVLERADFVTLHVPLTADTRHLIGARELALMKDTAILVNTARGPVVDQDALRVALERGEIAGAALDVTDPEPLPAGDPLLGAPNLLVVPHIGSATVGARHAMTDLAVDNLLAALDGRPMPHPA